MKWHFPQKDSEHFQKVTKQCMDVHEAGLLHPVTRRTHGPVCSTLVTCPMAGTRTESGTQPEWEDTGEAENAAFPSVLLHDPH